MRAASIAINLALFAVTFALVLRCFRKDGQWILRRGLSAFRYFTVLSNVLCAVAALALAACQLGGDAPRGAILLKYVGTASVAVTMLTVLLFLGPTQGYREMLRGENLYMHLLGPLLAILSFCFLEKVDMSFGEALLGLLPVAAYGVLYLEKVIFAPEERRWEDFYGFNRGGRWPLTFAAMLLGTFTVCMVLWRL